MTNASEDPAVEHASLAKIREALRSYRDWRRLTGRAPSPYWVARVATALNEHGVPVRVVPAAPARLASLPYAAPPALAPLEPEELEKRKARWKAGLESLQEQPRKDVGL